MPTYTVQSGDTLTSIAAQFGVTLAALAAANPQISNPNMISVGQVLTVPGSSTRSSGTGTSGQGNGVQAISVQNVGARRRLPRALLWEGDTANWSMVRC
jgi:LysM repeat protein